MNVLLITTDQQRADTLGVEGIPLGATPRLDAFAAQGTRFSGARARRTRCASRRAPRSSPAPIRRRTASRATASTCPADAEERSVATLLGRAGYRTAMFGKAHFATSFPFLPTGQVESVEGSARVDRRMERSVLRLRPRRARRCSATTCASPISWAGGIGRSVRRRSGCTTRATCSATATSAATNGCGSMQPEAAGAKWDHRQTWRNRLPEEEHLTTWVADRACEWLRRRRRSVLRLGELHRSASSDGRARAVVRPVRARRRARGAARRCIPTSSTTKPPLHKLLAQGARGRPLEWANPGGATLDARRPRGDDRGLLRHGRAARSRDRSRARRARRARASPTTRS